MTDPLLSEIHHICQFFLFITASTNMWHRMFVFFKNQNGTFQSWPRYYSLSTALLKKKQLYPSSPTLLLWTFYLAFYMLSPLFNKNASPSTQRQMNSVRRQWRGLCRNLHSLLERCCIIKSVASLAGWEIRINRETVLILVVSHKVCLQLRSNRISIHPFTVCHVPIYSHPLWQACYRSST